MKEICKYTMYHRNQGQIKDSHKAWDHSAEGLRAQPNKRLDTFLLCLCHTCCYVREKA